MSKVLYLGTDPSHYPEQVLHFPVIEISPLPLSEELQEEARRFFCASSDVIFTSKQAVALFLQLFGEWGGSLAEKRVYAVGEATARALPCSANVASDPCQEGLVALFAEEEVVGRKIFYPASKQARPLLREELRKRGAEVYFFPFYEPRVRREAVLPPLEGIEKVVFTSPSVVDAFFSLFSENTLLGKEIEAIGPITAEALRVRRGAHEIRNNNPRVSL